MSDVYGPSSVTSGGGLIEQGKNRLLFGKVINVKFTRKKPDRNGNTSFTIRSDYEPVFGMDGSVSFRTCSPKPEISITYDQVSSNTVISVELRITSLFIDRELTGQGIDNYADNPIMSATIQLGYIDQFPRWDRVVSPDDIARFYDLDNNVIVNGAAESSAATELTVQVLNAIPEGNPPERVWLFNCIVGNYESLLRWDHTVDDLKENYNDGKFPSGYSQLEAFLFHWITRRCVRSGVIHSTTTETVNTTGGSSSSATTTIQNVSVYDYPKYKGGKADGKWTRLILDGRGILSVDDANAVGVVCVVSETLRGKSLDDLVLSGTLGAGGTASVDPTPFDDPMDKLDAQLIAIQNHYPSMRWYILPSGNMYVYDVADAKNGLFKDPMVRNTQGKAVALPAIYDMTMSGLRTIRLPFIGVIAPMTVAYFQSRYRIADLVGYFTQPKYEMDQFLVILSKVEFSTTGDSNMMTLQCVDVPDEDRFEIVPATGEIVPAVQIAPSEQTYSSNVEERQKKRNLAWAEASVNVGKFPYDNVYARWVDIAQNVLFKNMKAEDWNNTPPTLEKALSDLRDWNSGGVWRQDRMTNSEGVSPENKLVPSLAFTIPWLYEGDIIKLKLPYKPSYDKDYRGKDYVVNG